MPIKIVLEKDRYCTKVFCDHCGQIIEHAHQGNYEWRYIKGQIDGEIFFTHKRCCRAFEFTNTDYNGQRITWMAGSLTDFVLFLKNNLHITKRDFEHAGSFLSMWDDLG